MARSRRTMGLRKSPAVNYLLEGNAFPCLRPTTHLIAEISSRDKKG